MMEVDVFINNFRKAFGEEESLPFAFWYSDEPADSKSEKINGCFFKEFARLMEDGETVTLSGERIGCMGGKFYTGFSDMNERVPFFVSEKEKYKKTPAMVLDFIQKTDVRRTPMKYLNISPVDKIDSFENISGVFCLVTPDILSGLAAWAFYDNNADDAVTARFGSGCSSIFAEAVAENRKGGRRTFIGLLDPSVRRHIPSGLLSFTIPMSRFREMYETLPYTCLFD